MTSPTSQAAITLLRNLADRIENGDLVALSLTSKLVESTDSYSSLNYCLEVVAGISTIKKTD